MHSKRDINKYCAQFSHIFQLAGLVRFQMHFCFRLIFVFSSLGQTPMPKNEPKKTHPNKNANGKHKRMQTPEKNKYKYIAKILLVLFKWKLGNASLLFICQDFSILNLRFILLDVFFSHFILSTEKCTSLIWRGELNVCARFGAKNYYTKFSRTEMQLQLQWENFCEIAFSLKQIIWQNVSNLNVKNQVKCNSFRTI